MTWINVGCGTHRAPAPWVNLDSHRGDGVNPDVVVTPGEPLPYDDDSCERVFLSHVLEHIPWEDLPDFLRDVRRVACGEVMIVGPDTYRVIESYRSGRMPWSLVASVMEHKDYPDDMAAWPGAPHHWNCHEARVAAVLDRVGFTSAPVLDHSLLTSWPVVGWEPLWQFALIARPDRRVAR